MPARQLYTLIFITKPLRDSRRPLSSTTGRRPQIFLCILRPHWMADRHDVRRPSGAACEIQLQRHLIARQRVTRDLHIDLVKTRKPWRKTGKLHRRGAEPDAPVGPRASDANHGLRDRRRQTGRYRAVARLILHRPEHGRMDRNILALRRWPRPGECPLERSRQRPRTLGVRKQRNDDGNGRIMG
jgi:hypothetical protein